MIVVTTPTGQIGRQVLGAVLDSGEQIRVIVRDPARLPEGVRERVEVVPGSHAEADVVTKAFAGAGRVFWLVPPNSAAESVEGYILGFTRPACEAIVSQGVRRVVGVSSLGRGVARNAGQISAVLAMDELIEGTGVSYRALWVPGFMENVLAQVELIKSRGVFRSPLSGDLRLPTCSTGDIAATAARLLLDDSWSGQGGAAVLGPEDLSHNDMARIMSEVLRRPIGFEHVPPEEYRTILVRHGMSEAWAQGFVDMAAQVERGIYHAQPRTEESTTPTSFRRWCERVLRPAVLG
ncbi:NAD(P)H-binding protein [Pseudonocardia acaciae]|uniref:NmrA family NAD(P)-binding protein n=1 Tax=Pseudonocardia acaciae TaxID=551276 RepID=UPI00048C07C0|nr:NAD(P)H-binding protein [Pseudonocardia acaciae]